MTGETPGENAPLQGGGRPAPSPAGVSNVNAGAGLPRYRPAGCCPGPTTGASMFREFT